MPAIGEELGGGHGVGFFVKPSHGVDTVGFPQRLTDFDIAVAGFRCGRLHPESDDVTRTGGVGGSLKRGLQGGVIGDRGIRRHHPQDGVRILFRHQHRGRGDCRGAVAADRFQHDARIFYTGGAQLLGDQEAMLLVADNNWRRETRVGGAQSGFLHHRPVRHQRPELLGEAFPRDRPQPCAGTAGQDNGNDSRFVHGLLHMHSLSCPSRWALPSWNRDHYQEG